jgi:hypothetical protein
MARSIEDGAALCRSLLVPPPGEYPCHPVAS